MSLSDIVDAQITAATRFPSRLGFGTPLVLAYLTGFADRMRTVADTDELAALGIVQNDQQTGKVYAAVAAAFAQNPRPPVVKIGRRVGAPSQSIRLTPTDPAEGHVTTVTIGGVVFSFTSTATETVAEITAALTLLINADADAILATGASSASAQVLTSFDGVIGAGAISPPRNLTLAFDSSVDWDPTTVTVTGKDSAGRTITEDFSAATDASLTGAKIFASVTQIDVPIQTGAGGTFTVGVGSIFANAELEITATDNTTSLTVAADNVGDWYSFAGFDSRLEVKDLTAEPATTLATDLAACNLEDSDWYCLEVADGQSQAQIEAAAAWVETAKKFYVAHSFDTDCTQDVDTDVASQLQLSSIFRTHVHYQRNGSGVFPALAWAAVVLPRDPGSITWEFKEASGVPVDTLNSDQVRNLTAKNASRYVRIRSKNVMLGSKTAAGEWMDVVRFIDWLVDEVSVDVFDEISGSPKKAFTRGGISAVVGRVRNVGRRGQAIGGLDPDAEIVVVEPALADLVPSDIADRELKGITFNWRLAGAIHAVEIRGTVGV